MTFPYHNGGFEDREATIRARIARNARLQVTKLTVPCAESQEPVPDPENTQRGDLICGRGLRLLYGERAVERGLLRLEV